MYRPLWSKQIMAEMVKVLETKLKRTREQAEYRKQKMSEAFPEAMVTFPPDLTKAVGCIPDKNDRHVLAAAIMARANTIVTQNIKHFPKDCLERFGVSRHTPDDFLVRQYEMSHELVLSKLDDQAVGVRGTRAGVISSLRLATPSFCKLLQQHL